MGNNFQNLPKQVKALRFIKICLICFALASTLAADDTDLRLDESLRLMQSSQGQAPQSAAPEQDDRYMMDLLLAVNSMDLARIQRALSLYKLSADAKKEIILFAQANVEFLSGNLSRAIKLYEQLLRLDDGFVRAHLDLARLYFLDHQNKEAMQLFESIKLPRQNVMLRVQQFKDAIRARNALGGSFSLGFVYGKNINQSSQKSIKQIFNFNNKLYESTRKSPDAISAYGLRYDLSLSKQFPLAGHHNAFFRLTSFGNFYRKYGIYSDQTVQLGLGYKYKSGAFSLQGAPVFERVFLDKKRLLDRTGLSLEFGKHFADLYAGFYADFKQEKYKGAFSFYNGDTFNATPSFVWATRGAVFVFGGLDFLQKSRTKDAKDSYKRYGARLGFSKGLSKLDFIFSASLRGSFYKGANRALSPTPRKDLEQIYTLTAKFKSLNFGGRLTPALSYSYTANKANIDWLYSYKRSDFLLKLESVF